MVCAAEQLRNPCGCPKEQGTNQDARGSEAAGISPNLQARSRTIKSVVDKFEFCDNLFGHHQQRSYTGHSTTMSNWDDDDFEVAAAPVIAAKGKWEGEDEDEEDIPVPLPFPITFLRL
jgi:hypothetical protein